MGKYLEEAKRYLEIGEKEIKEGKEKNIIEKAINGCEKIWLSFNLALKEFLLQKGVKEEELPGTTRGLRFMVVKYGGEELISLFRNVRDVFHTTGFYDRDPMFEEIEELLSELKEFYKNLEDKKYG